MAAVIENTSTVEHTTVNLRDLIVGDVIYEVDIDGSLYGPDIVLMRTNRDITVVTYDTDEIGSTMYELALDNNNNYTRVGHINVDKYLTGICKEAAELKI
jgi:hypothetical protein